MGDVDPNDAGGSPGRPLGRGLEDISRLFASPKSGDAPAADASAARPPERAAALPASRGGVALLRPASITRERLAAVLTEFDGALEDGLRIFDAKIPCHPCGEIDLLGVDRASRLTLVDFDMNVEDGLLLRGIGHFDWVVRNLPNVQRMYREQPVNFTLPPRLVLVAPQFSVMLRSVARQISRPELHWIRYHTVAAAGGPAVLFEAVGAD